MIFQYPYYSCQECHEPCFDFEETGVCPKEAWIHQPVDCCLENDYNPQGIKCIAEDDYTT